MIKVFIAGKYNDGNIMKCLLNIRNGQRAAYNLMLMGYAPFCPFLDYQLVLHSDYDDGLNVYMLKDISIAFLKVCDCMYILPSWKDSDGAKAEIEIAIKEGIPIFSSIEKLDEYYKQKEGEEV